MTPHCLLSHPSRPSLIVSWGVRAVLDTMEACLGELRDTHGGDLGSLSVEDGMGRAFDKSVRTQLRSVWNKVGRKTKQLVSDLEVGVGVVGGGGGSRRRRRRRLRGGRDAAASEERDASS